MQTTIELATGCEPVNPTSVEPTMSISELELADLGMVGGGLAVLFY